MRPSQAPQLAATSARGSPFATTILTHPPFPVRFVDCETWRKETKLDEVVPNWEYPEKEQVFKYYPQYYHKTDKVRLAYPPTRGGGCP